mgnify:FL=1
MSERQLVVVSVDVKLDPAAAFEAFTGEIDRWWRPGAQNWNNRFRAVGIRIEPGVGGRWLELLEEPAEVFECGRISVWEPPTRFAFVYQDIGHDIDGTEVEVSFEPIESGTRVTLEHGGWEKLDPGLAARKRETKTSGWGHILVWYREWASWGSPRRVANPVWQQSNRPRQVLDH